MMRLTAHPADSECNSESSNEHDKEEGSKIGEQQLRLALAALKAQSILHSTRQRRTNSL